MTRTDKVNTWLLVPQATGLAAALCAAAAILLPTLIRLAVDDVVSECAFLPYLPFILLGAILMDWRNAVVVVAVSGVIADLLFTGPRYQFLEGPDDIFGFIAFLISSVLILGLVQMVRNVLRDRRREELGGAVIFSLEGGEAWARSSGTSSSVRLGPQDEVAVMMADFLAQLELGKRLTR